MIVTVQLFAAARDCIGRPTVQVDLNGESTVAGLRQRLAIDFPALAAILPHAQMAVDAEYVTNDFPLQSTSDVALIPPVSGG